MQAFKQQVLEAIDPDTKNVLLDLSHVDFIDSSCLGALVSILKSVNGQGELALCSLNDTIKTCLSSPVWIASLPLRRPDRMR